MSEKYDPDNIFGKAIGQLIHDIRNPLNTIIGFSSIIRIDETVSEEMKGYVNKIFHSGMSIEKMLSNIDHFMMENIRREDIDFEILTATKNYFNTLKDFMIENQIEIEYLNEYKINVFFSLEIFNKILDNLFHFSYKGLRTSKTRDIQILFKEKNNKEILIFYSDSSTPVFIEGEYFNFEEILKSRRGLGVMFIEKYITSCNGKIEYKYGKKWQSIVADLDIKMKNNHGFILQMPIIKQ